MDAHSRSPAGLREDFRRWRGSDPAQIESSSNLIDLSKYKVDNDHVCPVQMLASRNDIEEAFIDFNPAFPQSTSLRASTHGFELKDFPGLLVYPALIPVTVQIALLDKLLHRDLSNRVHQTNLHLFHEISYPGGHNEADCSTNGSPISFFAADMDTKIEPKDPSIHKPFTLGQMLRRKLRWITLGGQYDWTAKTYPEDEPPAFPDDVARLLKALFPQVDPQAAIVNIYSPGDTLSIHRDISEECDCDLISISLGCDCLFLMGSEAGGPHMTLRLRSGDVVLMTGPSRYAFHAVPKVLAGTCPAELEAWPAVTEDSRYEQWKDWLKTKRININIRQMTD